ncbi:putative non-specific serine/threonine protein kinase [Helianthus anomalus]
MDPCYFYTGKLTRKYGVYAFGAVLFEVLSGRQAVDQTLDEDQWNLAVWAQDHFKEGRLDEIIDHGLIGQISKQCLKEFASLAVLCLHDQQRPTMAEVTVKLRSILSRERESVGSVAVDTRFFSKTKVMPTHAEGSKSNLPESLISEIDSFNGKELVD